MPPTLHVVTGATGLLGSYIVEQLRSQGETVRALVRPSSKSDWLREQGVELVTGNLADSASLGRAFAGATTVYHSAARVGDWGPWRLFQEEIIDGTAKVLDAAKKAGVNRVLYVSSVSVYGYPKLKPGEVVTEDRPLGENRFWFWDRYCRSKIEAEEIARTFGSLVTTVRPSSLYGLRDRGLVVRMLRAFRARWGAYVTDANQELNILHAGDAANGAILAAASPQAAGRIYNLGSEGGISQRDFFRLITDALGVTPFQRCLPFSAAYAGGFLSEAVGRVF